MKTFNNKEEFIKYFENTNWNSQIVKRDFERVKEKEFTFNTKEQYLENMFNIIRTAYFFEDKES